MRPSAKRSKPRTTVPATVGRPTDYREEYASLAEQFCLLGATEQELADRFGVVVNTITNWKAAHPEFLGALKAGKEQADANVAKSLYRRALGYEHEAVKITVHAESGMTTVTPYTERYAPDTTAGIFWLKNRRPDLWREKQGEKADGLDLGSHPGARQFLAAVHTAITEICSPVVAEQITVRIEQLMASHAATVAA